MTIHLVLGIVALTCFLGAALEIKRPGTSTLIAAGLFLWLLSTLLVAGR